MPFVLLTVQCGMQVSVTSVTTNAALRQFISLPTDLYSNTPEWVPTFRADYRAFYRRRHPFFAHAEAEFLLAQDEAGTSVGRVMMIRNDRYNAEHGTAAAHFYFLEMADDPAVAHTLFSAMERWAQRRGLDSLIGPVFSGATFGGGVLIEGFDRSAAMTMMPYNHPYYGPAYEAHGFKKRFDLLSLKADPQSFRLPEKVEKLAEFVRSRGRFEVLHFRNKRQIKRIAPAIAALYNPTLADHPENYPLTKQELDQVTKDLLQIAQPDLEKIITYDGDVVGFLFGFPDITGALKRAGGRIGPRAIVDLILSSKRTTKLILNGMGILEKYQRLGGNALIYSELARTIQGTRRFAFTEAEMVQINESTDLMLADMFRLGATIRKRHRVFEKQITRRAL